MNNAFFVGVTGETPGSAASGAQRIGNEWYQTAVAVATTPTAPSASATVVAPSETSAPAITPTEPATKTDVLTPLSVDAWEDWVKDEIGGTTANNGDAGKKQ